MLDKLPSSKSSNTSLETTALVVNMVNWVYILRIIRLKACLFILKLPKVSLIQWNRAMLWAQNKSKQKPSKIIRMIIDVMIQSCFKILHKIRKTLKSLKRNTVRAVKVLKNISFYQMWNHLYSNSFLILLLWEILWTVTAKKRSQVQFPTSAASLQNQRRSKPSDIALTKLISDQTLRRRRTARTTRKRQLPPTVSTWRCKMKVILILLQTIPSMTISQRCWSR